MPDWRDRLTDARRFLEVAEAVHDPDHLNQAVSNAILAMIAANDAVCLYSGKPVPRGEAHDLAAQALRRATRGTKWEREAAERSRVLLEVVRLKSAAQYTGERLDGETAARVLTRAARFIEWVRLVTADR